MGQSHASVATLSRRVERLGSTTGASAAVGTIGGINALEKEGALEEVVYLGYGCLEVEPRCRI